MSTKSTSNDAVTPAAGSDEVRGIVCKHCDCPDLRVVRTRPGWRGKVYRWRLCQNPNCGRETVTTESAAR